MSRLRNVCGSVRRGCALACAAAAAWWSNGCATTSAVPEKRPPQVAAVVLRNVTPHAWRVTFREAEGVKAVVVHVAPRATDEVSFAQGGEFFIEQVVETASSDRPAPRSFNARFNVGQRYQWTLATLLTATGGESIGL